MLVCSVWLSQLTFCEAGRLFFVPRKCALGRIRGPGQSRIAEEGSYSELLVWNGLYSMLSKRNLSGFIETERQEAAE